VKQKYPSSLTDCTSYQFICWKKARAGECGKYSRFLLP